MADNSTAGGLDWGSYADTVTGNGAGSSTGNTGGTDYLTALGNLANAGANAYRAANTQQPKPATSNSLLLILGGAVVLVLVLVLALRK
jgi:cobalamin biosynthesis Mg chelatase CobN